MSYPKISIITPCYNKADFLEEAIQSVLQQDYSNLEFIIIDGGSTDGSVEIIKKYEDQLAYWESEKDRGQCHAMNKGLAKATGEILSILNADDVYNLGVFRGVGGAFQKFTYPTILLGNIDIADVNLSVRSTRKPCTSFSELIQLQRFKMPNNPVGYFYHRKIHDKIGGFNEEERYAMDYDFLLKAFQICTIEKEEKSFGKFRYDVNSLTYNHTLQDKFYLHKKALKEVQKRGKKYGVILWWAERLARRANKFDKSDSATFYHPLYRFYTKMLLMLDTHLNRLSKKNEI